MHRLTPVFIAGALAVSAGLVLAQSQTGGNDSTSHEAHGTAHEADSGSAATQAFRAANDRMHRDMAIEFTGDADVDFMRAMIPHHQGAIDMARVVLEHGSDPQVKALAAEVISAQEAEIGMMREWLAKRGQ